MKWALLLLVAGCAREASAPQVFVVGGTPALREPLEAAARARQGEVSPTLLFGPPADLLVSGTPIDLLVGESHEVLPALAGKVSWQRDLASNALCLVVRKSERNTASFATLKDAGGWPNKIALADSRGEGPASGAEAAIGRLALRVPLTAKLLYAGAGDDVLVKLARGEVDAALAFGPHVTAWNAAHPEAQLQIADRADDPRARIVAAIPTSSARSALARKFADNLAASHLFEERGYGAAAR
jgi:ABC-type molybdate transport system substrate-binding protein